MTDRYLLEAMREVDELTPACPPIAPDPDDALIEVDCSMSELANQVLVTDEGVWVYKHASSSVKLYAELRQAQLMQNVANRPMTDEEYRGMRNTVKP